MKRIAQTLGQRTPYRIYFTRRLPECQGKKRKDLYNLYEGLRRVTTLRLPAFFRLTFPEPRGKITAQCGRGGIGRLGGFRFLCVSVQVRVLSPAPINKGRQKPPLIYWCSRWDSNPSKCNMPVAYCCHQFKNWWLHLSSPIPGRRRKSSPVVSTKTLETS